MAVTKNVRGLGIGSKLSHRIIEQAKSLGANEIYLQTSLKLKAVSHIYRQLGFRKVQKSPFSDNIFIKPTFTMKLILK